MANSLTGRVIHPSDPGYADGRLGFAARFDYEANAPAVIVFAQRTQDVVNAVQWARATGTPVRVRAGRHSYQAYSSLIEGGIVVDVSEMLEVDVDSTEATAWVGAGLDALQLTEVLSESGFGMPMATGPSVGVAGLVQGGGVGMTTRLQGLVCDNALEFEVVDANGQVLRASDDENPDLYWALRGGGGGNFGVVTRIRFQVYRVSTVGIFNVQYRWEDFLPVVDAWQRWAPETDPRITCLISMHSDLTITVQGQYTAEDEALPLLNDFLKPMLSDSGLMPVNVQVMFVPFLQGARTIFGVDPMNPSWALRAHDDTQLFKSASAVALAPIPMEGLQTVKTALENAPVPSAPPSQPTMIQFLGGGGKAAEPATDATAVFYRKAKFIVQYDGYWTAPEDAAPTEEWVKSTRESMLAYASGAYVNYHDADLGDGYMEAYYGDNGARLRQVKAQYDPENFFQFAQSIPPAT